MQRPRWPVTAAAQVRSVSYSVYVYTAQPSHVHSLSKLSSYEQCTGLPPSHALKPPCKWRRCQTQQQVPIAGGRPRLCRNRRSSTLALVGKLSAAQVAWCHMLLLQLTVSPMGDAPMPLQETLGRLGSSGMVQQQVRPNSRLVRWQMSIGTAKTATGCRVFSR